jgi:transposase
MKPYSSDLCEKIIQAYRNGDSSLRDIAKRFLVSLNFVWLLWQRYLTTGSVEPKPPAGGQVSVMTKERLSVLRDLVEEQNDATLKELQEKFRQQTGLSVSSGTISKALKKLKLPRKKKTFHATERENDPKIIQEREKYIQEMPGMDTQHLVIIDEFGVNLGFARE